MTPSTDDIPQRESQFQSNVVMMFGVFLFLAGLALNAEMYLTGPWRTYLYYALMALGLVVFLLGLWSKGTRITRREPKGFIKNNIAFFVLPGVFILSLAYQVGAGVQTVIEEQMIWSFETPSEDATQMHIIFRFVDYPEHFISVHSSDLAEKLESYGQEVVDVRILVTIDFGVTRGFQLAQVGPFTEWSGVTNYPAGSDVSNAPPWMK